MEKLQMCRICLVENVHMYVVVNRNLHKLYEKLTDIPFITEDRRPMLACFFCCAKLKQCYRLLRKCLKAEELFAHMTNEDYEPNILINQDHLEFSGGFIKSPTENISIVDVVQTESIAIKEELPAVCEGLDDIIEPKEEPQSDDSTMEISPNPEESSNAVTVQVDAHHRHCSQLSASVATTNHVCVNETQATSDVSSIHPGYPKTAAERMREYRSRKKKETLTVNHQKQKRSAAERAKEYRIRKKMKIHSGELELENMNNSGLDVADIPPHCSESDLEYDVALIDIKTEVEEQESPTVYEELDNMIEPHEEHQSDELELENLDNSCLDVADIRSYPSFVTYDVPLEFTTEVEEEQAVSTNKRRASEMTRATVAKKQKLDTRRTKLEDTETAEQTRKKKPDSKVIRTTQKCTSKTGAYKCDRNDTTFSNW